MDAKVRCAEIVFDWCQLAYHNRMTDEPSYNAEYKRTPEQIQDEQFYSARLFRYSVYFSPAVLVLCNDLNCYNPVLSQFPTTTLEAGRSRTQRCIDTAGGKTWVATFHRNLCLNTCLPLKAKKRPCIT